MKKSNKIFPSKKKVNLKKMIKYYIKFFNTLPKIDEI